MMQQRDVVEIDGSRVRRAGNLAEQYALRGYDAVHLAAADRVRDRDLVVVLLCRRALDQRWWLQCELLSSHLTRRAT